MAKFKKSRKSEEKVKELAESVASEEEEVTSTAPQSEVAETAVPEENKYLNSDEKEVLESQEDNEEQGVSVEKMSRAVDLVSKKFNLTDKGFVVTGFVDKGSKVTVALANADFDITITIKDSEKYGIY